MSAHSVEHDHEAERRILRERARRLAKVPDREDERAAALEVVRFRLGENTYAIEARFVFATRWLHELTPVPGTPPSFLGISPHKGGVIAVVALDVLFGSASAGVRDLHRVLVIGATQPEIGLAAGKEIEVAWIGEDALLPALDGDDAGSRIVAGHTEDGLTLLDGAALLADERMFNRSPRSRESARPMPNAGE